MWTIIHCEVISLSLIIKEKARGKKATRVWFCNIPDAPLRPMAHFLTGLWNFFNFMKIHMRHSDKIDFMRKHASGMRMAPQPVRTFCLDLICLCRSPTKLRPLMFCTWCDWTRHRLAVTDCRSLTWPLLKDSTMRILCAVYLEWICINMKDN